MEDVHVYVERPAEKKDESLEDLGDAIRGLDPVSGVDVDAPGNVLAVSYEGGKKERDEITRAVEEAGYTVSRLSIRSTLEEGRERGLWDI